MTENFDLPIAFTWPSKAVPKNEKAFRKKFIKKFIAEHPRCWTYVPRDMLRIGVPDLLAVVQGHAVALEFKIQGNKPTPLQIATIADLDAAGAWARFIIQGRDGIVRSLRYDEV